MTTGMAFASEGEEVEFEGIVINVFPDESLIEVEVNNDGVLETYFVHVGENFDFESILGELIEVKGTLNEEGVLVMTELKIQEREQEQEQEQEGMEDSIFCTSETASHPLGLKISTTYGVEYSVIEEYMCGENHVPIGQIKLAVQTAALTDPELGIDYTYFLDGFEGISWGQVWQELGLKGKPEHGVPFGQLKFGDAEDDEVPPGQQKKSEDEFGNSEKDYQTASQIGNKYGVSQDTVLGYHQDFCDGDWSCTRAHFREEAGNNKQTGKPDKKDKPNKDKPND
jgi:pyruvate/2-oxoglutarate dehydrogenase complex dihydrolipoamide acyltransferase (E2) component